MTIINIDDVILIKINQSYYGDISPGKLYEVTSISWKISERKLETLDIKYYCAVYNSEIIEVYRLIGYKSDTRPEKEGRFILEGELADEAIREKLIALDVQSIHKGSGNPVKYTMLETLLNLKEQSKLPAEPEIGKLEIIEVVDLIEHIHSCITSKGFNYSLPNIKNFYLSLRSKPFVIISGISGTGKTKIVQLFAESVGATEENGQFKLIPVRPDWSDGSELLGYTDITGDFKKGPLTEMIEHAMDCPSRPHFVLLDEMNLARVEYYFSDVLSVMESRRRDGDKIISSYLLDKKATGVSLRLPENLYIIGTVNMDETTHPFSKKVLDRANTIEFNEIYLENFDFFEEQEEVEVQPQPQPILNEQLVANYISLKDVYDTHSSLITLVSNRLVAINKFLEPLNAHVGYRVRDEICFYMIHNAEAELLDENEAFDYCMIQKLLPRITGGDGRVDTLLNDLFEWLTGESYDSGNIATSASYPRSTRKVVEMLGRYHADGFTSFWIS
ncbi:AAA family ATPase [Sporosarcina sp. E16_3]|uniref:McrB family protein n=1 Tax=Sporosarcina sp. E16_3 TaxID=2789293 RepID=UPI0021053073|nr:AAA family ATPase [Sporosarcina sp. E16_3]